MGVEWPFGDEQVIFHIHAWVSNRGADLDNLIKPLLDTYQQTFEAFNDNKVYGLMLYKGITKKGEEHLIVNIQKANSYE